MFVYVYLQENVEQLGQLLSGIYRRDGKWCYVLSELTATIPPLVRNIVDEISLCDSIPSCPSRIRGIYQYEDVEATLDWCNNRNDYWLTMRGKNMENMYKLYRMIRAGKIAPTESWE